MPSNFDYLMYVPIFADLTEETIQKIASVGFSKKYAKDEVIFREDDQGTAMFVILTGKVKVVRTSGDGREVILTILSQYDFFGEMALLDGLSRSASVLAAEDAELFIIHRDDFLNLLKQYPEISINLMQELTQRLRAADLKIKSLSLKDAEGKVATVLLQLAEEIGKIKHGIVEIEKLPLQQDLANMAGTSRETISRTLHSFAKKGFVELDGSKLKILNFDKFRDSYL